MNYHGYVVNIYWTFAAEVDKVKVMEATIYCVTR